MPKAKETGAASAPAKRTAGRRGYHSYGKIKPAPGKSKVEPKPIKISFLGGLNEVGKNMTLFEYGEDMFLVDCGLAFPDQDMLGVDLVLPDFTYVERNADRIRGIVITHGHEDHIGGLPYLLKVLNVPVYGTNLTIGLIQGKLREHGLLNSATLNVIKPGDVITLGGFTVEAIHVNHSIPDALGLAIRCEGGTIVHTGDFKIDTTPIDGGMMDLGRLAEIGQEGVLCLMSDSTNAERPGFTESERKVGESFETLFRKAGNNRIIVATFSSNIHRVQQIMNVAESLGRKVALVGRSLENVVNISAELGYLNIPEGIVIDINMINRYPADKLVIITTGSQGEPMSALTRMAFSDHRKVEIHPNDYVIISATPIPGNEKTVSRVVNELMKLGADVVYERMYDVHVSGHACQEEIKTIIDLVKPQYYIPVHGEYKHLYKNAGLARLMGLDDKHIIIPEIGRVLEFSADGKLLTEETVPAGRVLVDGIGVGDVGNVVLRDRKQLSEDGMIVAVLSVDSNTGEIISGPDIISRGFVYVKESERLIEDAKDLIVRCAAQSWKSSRGDLSVMKTKVREALNEYMYGKTKRSPMVLPVIMGI